MDVQSIFAMANKRILVIGGAQGIGEASARLLATLACELIVLDTDFDRAALVCTDIRGLGGKACPATADITDEGSLVAALAKMQREFGTLDGMVAAAGMTGWTPIVDMSTAVWDLDQSRNLRFFFIAARELARGLLERGTPGSIVVVSTVGGIRSAPDHASAGAANAGLMHLVNSMASEWSEHGIRVNCVAAGPTVSERNPLAEPEKERAGLASVPMRRRGTPEEVARAVLFFLSDMSTYVTGQTLAVDGGYVGEWGFGPRTTPSRKAS